MSYCLSVTKVKTEICDLQNPYRLCSNMDFVVEVVDNSCCLKNPIHVIKLKVEGAV